VLCYLSYCQLLYSYCTYSLTSSMRVLTYPCNFPERCASRKEKHIRSAAAYPPGLSSLGRGRQGRLFLPYSLPPRGERAWEHMRAARAAMKVMPMRARVVVRRNGERGRRGEGGGSGRGGGVREEGGGGGRGAE